MAAAANLLRWVVRPLSAADVSSSSRSSSASRVIDLAIAADEILRIVSLSSAAHLLAVLLDLEMSSAANEALRVVGFGSAARSRPGVLESGFQVVAAAGPLGPVVRVGGTRLAMNALVGQIFRV